VRSTHEESDRVIARHLALVQRVTLILGLALVLIGTAFELSHRGHIGTAAVTLVELPARLAGLHGDAILTLGLLVLLGAPAVGLVYLAVALLRAKDKLHALFAVIVLSILLGSILFKGLL
jgi:uncharacterized membrane protein